jgi:cytochrome P450
VQTVLRDRRFVNPPGLALAMYGIANGPLWDRVTTNILTLDGDQHTRLRRLVAQSFTPRSANDMQLRMQQTMRELLNAHGERLDVVELVATYPLAIICALLGIPREDWGFISRNIEDQFRVFRTTVVADQPVILAAMGAMDTYVDRLIARRHHEGLVGHDLISELLRAEAEGDRLTIDEVRMLVTSVLAGGTDTTRNQLAAGIDTFADHPDQWALLHDDPGLVGSAVDEVLRHAPIVLGVYRTARADTLLGDVAVPAGTMIHVIVGAANRDPATFAHADRFDITRAGPAPALTFGGGIHHCLGVHLAKAELAEGLKQMSHRWATIARAGAAPWKPRNGISGPITLPIAVNETLHAAVLQPA